VSKFDPLPRYDAWIDQMSLPLAFGTACESIPFPGGYLGSCAVVKAGRHRIGLAWRGNPAHNNDRRRTPPPDAFAPLIKAQPGRFVSLVPGEILPGVAAPPFPLTDYAATAALIAGLDLVITVDTSVAHLAGALGRPAWVLLPFAPDWRWMLDRNDTPWYDSVRLFRQPSPGLWAAVINGVIADVGLLP